MLTFEPQINVILSHISQLSQVVQLNQDVISSLEAGFIGNHGEWFYSHPTLSSFGIGSPSNIDSNLTFKNNRIQVANAIISMAQNRIVAFRTPYFQKLLAPNPVIPYYTNNVYSKVACHNDAFLHDITDQGTYRENPNTLVDRNYLSQQSKYNFTGGETNTLNSNFATCVNAALNSPLNKTSIQQMQDYHFSYLNHSFFEGLMDPNTGFFATEVSPPALPTDGNWLQEIKRRMGYRFVLTNSNISSNTLTINLQNKGFGNVFNQRKIYLVLKNGSTLYKVNISGPHDSKNPLPVGYSTEVRVWMAGSSIMLSRNLLGMVTTAATPGVPIGTIVPPGTYSLYLELPDQILENFPKYSIRFANNNVWDENTGFNSLNRSVTITSSTASRITQNDFTFFDVSNYPNPFTESFKLDISTCNQEQIIVQVYDIVGKLVESRIINFNDINNIYLGSDLSKGIYHVLVKQGNNNKTIRVVKK